METNTTPEFTFDAPQAASLPPAADVLMVRAPGQGGIGVTRANVPAAEVENYIKAGWHRA